jgi:hypothetical protein
VIEQDGCPACIDNHVQTVLTTFLGIRLKKCPYCNTWVYDDETGNYHLISCAEAHGFRKTGGER